MAWNAKETPAPYAQVAEALGGKSDPEEAAPLFARLLKASRLDTSLSEAGVVAETLSSTMLLEENRPMMENNARKVTPEDALELARRTLGLH